MCIASEHPEILTDAELNERFDYYDRPMNYLLMVAPFSLFTSIFSAPCGFLMSLIITLAFLFLFFNQKPFKNEKDKRLEERYIKHVRSKK